MRIGFVGDLHAADTAPQSRKDNYYDAILTKMDGIKALVKQWDIDGLVWLGDIFHQKKSARVSDRLRRDLIFRFQDMGAHNFVVPGNHDMNPKGVEGLDHQPLGTLEAAGAIRILRETDPFSLGDGTAWLVPRPYDAELDADPEYYPLTEEEKNYINSSSVGHNPVIVVAHGSVLPPGEERPYPYVNVDEIPGIEDVDLFVSGHIHEGLGIHELPGGGYFANPGSVGRVARTQANLVRPVQLFLADISEGKIQGQMIDIPGYAPGSEVFQEAVEVEEVEASDSVKQFVGAVAGGLQLDGMSLSEVMAGVGTENDEVKALMRHYLEEADDS